MVGIILRHGNGCHRQWITKSCYASSQVLITFRMWPPDPGTQPGVAENGIMKFGMSQAIFWAWLRLPRIPEYSGRVGQNGPRNRWYCFIKSCSLTCRKPDSSADLKVNTFSWEPGPVTPPGLNKVVPSLRNWGNFFVYHEVWYVAIQVLVPLCGFFLREITSRNTTRNSQSGLASWDWLTSCRFGTKIFLFT